MCNKVLRNAPARQATYLKLAKLYAAKGFIGEAKQNFVEYAERMQKVGKIEHAFAALKEFTDISPESESLREMLAEHLKMYGADPGKRASAVGSRVTTAPKSAPHAGDDVSKSGKRKTSSLVFLDLDEPRGAKAPPAPPAKPAAPSPPPVAERLIEEVVPEPDESLFDATPEAYRVAPTACWGDHNPELMDQPFWQAMIRSGITAYAGAQLAGGTRDNCPVWCAQRFGQSLTLLPDGRAIQIGGEHEDSYDPDFCIYNDVFVHHPDGRIEIFCYPEDIFPPTDFHTATLIGDSIYIIGGLGYQGSRRFGETPVYQLDTNTLQIRRIETTGETPGWISRHRAVLTSRYEIQVWAGKIAAEVGETETYGENHRAYVFDVKRRHWRREPIPG